MIFMERINYSSGAKWEEIVGYSRAVQVGDLLEITGTVAAGEDGKVVGQNNAYEQTKFIIQKIQAVVQKAGFRLEDIIRTRLFVTDIARWEEYGRAHGEFFAAIRPCTTMIEVKALIEPEYLIEIEASAIVS